MNDPGTAVRHRIVAFSHYTLDTLGAFIGPLYGVLIADYFLVKKQKIDADAMYTLSPTGRYHFSGGYNPVAIVAAAVGAVLAMLLLGGPPTWPRSPGPRGGRGVRAAPGGSAAGRGRGQRSSERRARSTSPGTSSNPTTPAPAVTIAPAKV